MLSKIFKAQPVLDEASIAWVFDTYAWALQEFDARMFWEETQLVAPTNRFFPGRERSEAGMAQLIFERVQHYAGLDQWSFQLVDADQTFALDRGTSEALTPLRGSRALCASASAPLPIPYAAELVANPEASIAHFAQLLAHYLGTVATQPPPGGLQNWPLTTEVLAVFLGFGLMLVNSAHTAPASCGSCRVGLPTRDSHLSQYDLTYALSLFTVLKAIDARETLPHLKPSLRGYFKRALRDVRQRHEALERLRESNEVSPLGS